MKSFILSTEDATLLLEYERCGSMAKMAEIFQRDPSVISRNLKKLAEKLPVLEKIHGKWVVTELGKKFNAWTASAIISQQAIVEQKIELKIASTREFAHRYLVDNISTLFPPESFNIHLITFDSNSEKLLLNGQVDIVFDCGRPYDPQISFKRCAEEKMSLLVSKKFKQKNKVTSANDLAELPYIHYVRTNISNIRNYTKGKLNIGITVNDITLARQAILNSEGWGVLPTYTVKLELEEKTLIEVKQDKHWKLPSYQFSIWWNRDKAYLAPYINIATEWLKKQKLN